MFYKTGETEAPRLWISEPNEASETGEQSGITEMTEVKVSRSAF